MYQVSVNADANLHLTTVGKCSSSFTQSKCPPILAPPPNTTEAREVGPGTSKATLRTISAIFGLHEGIVSIK